MLARGIDLSRYNNPTLQNLIEWKRLGFCIGFYSVGIGLNKDPLAVQHRSNLLQAGYLTAPYIALHERDSPQAQAKLLIESRTEAEIELYLLDIERRELTTAMVLAFLDECDRLTKLPMWVYTNQSRWHQYFPTAALRQRSAKYGLLVAGYPFDRSDYMADGITWQGQLMDTASVALRSNPPVDRTPAIPGPWLQTDGWQHTGHGRLPGYERDLDLHIYPVTEEQLRARFAKQETPVTNRLKLGPHHLQGGSDTKAWLDLKPTVAKAVGDLGVLQEAPAGVLRVGRMSDDGQLPGGGFDANRYSKQFGPVPMATIYTDWLTRYIDSNPWVDVWEGPNEQVIETSEVMAWYSHFLYEFAKRIKAKGKRAGIGGWAVGNPKRELNLWPHYVWALQACLDQNAILTRHEYGPLDGFNSLRYRYDNAQFRLLGYLNLPVIISEAGADDAGGMTRWRNHYHNDIGRYWNELLRPYADAIARDAYCLGATVFCVGGEAGWSGFNVDGTGLVDRIRAYTQEVHNVDDTTTQVVVARAREMLEDGQRVTLNARALLDLLAPTAPSNWWDSWPIGVISPSRKLKATGRLTAIYAVDGVTAITAPRSQTGWDVTERKGALLRVLDQTEPKPDWYVKAQDVEPQ